MSSGFETSLIISGNSKRFLDFARNDKWCSSEPYLHSRISRGSEIRKAEHFGVMLAGQVVDPAKDRHVRIDLILRRDIDEAVIFDVEIRETEMQLFARVDKFRF